MIQQSKLPAIDNSKNDTRVKIGTRTSLKDMIASHRENLDKNETKSCLLELKDIKYIIDYYSDSAHLGNEEPIKAFRIYFFRQVPGKEYPSSKQKILKVGNKGQMSIIMVPVHNYGMGPNKEGNPVMHADDMFNKDEECLILYPGGESTGLCPTNCSGSEDAPNP